MGTRIERGLRVTQSRIAVVIATCCLVLATGTVVVAQDQPSDPLQGRILQNSDGTLFVYKDGQRYLLQVAPVGDDLINSIPTVGSVDRLDQLFAQPNQLPPVAAPVSAPPPPAVPPTPQVLYQADFSQGMSGWHGDPAWIVVNDLLTNRADGAGHSIQPPYTPDRPDYAIETEIRRASREYCDNSFRIRGRAGASNTSFVAAITNGCDGDRAELSGISNLASQSFNPGDSWHAYRFEMRGNHVKLSIDGIPFIEGSDGGTHSDRGVILQVSDNNVVIQVRSFKILALN